MGSKVANVLLSIVIIAMFIVLAIGSTAPDDNDEPEEDEKEEVEAVEVIENPETFEEEVEVLVGDLIDVENNQGDKRVIHVAHGEDEEGQYLFVTLRGDEVASTSLARNDILFKTVDLFEPLYDLAEQEEEEIGYISLFWSLSVVDAYGEAEDKDVIIVSFDKENANKVNWENVSIENIPVIATKYWQHPLFEE